MGRAADCPADAFIPAFTPHRSAVAASGDCDAAESCNGRAQTLTLQTRLYLPPMRRSAELPLVTATLLRAVMGRVQRSPCRCFRPASDAQVHGAAEGDCDAAAESCDGRAQTAPDAFYPAADAQSAELPMATATLLRAARRAAPSRRCVHLYS
jgi:hypothetical protein